jgi:hypothetical protein
MSYCRISSNDYQCDVYVYDAEDGCVQIHVAGRRHVGKTPIPKMPRKWWTLPPEDMLVFVRAQEEWLRQARLEPIGLPFDGESFLMSGPTEAAEKLEELEELGYLIPRSAINALRMQATLGDLDEICESGVDCANVAVMAQPRG